MAAILDFLPTIQCRKYFLTIPLCPAYMKTPGQTAKTRIGLCHVGNDSNLSFDLGKMAAILDFLPSMQRPK